MADIQATQFQTDGAVLLAKLLERSEKLKDGDYSPTVIEKGIAEARSLLNEGKIAEAQQKYTETKTLLERVEASLRAEPLAWKLLWVELGYLLLLLFVGFLTHKWPTYWLWAGLITVHAAAAWFGALGGVAVGLYGLYSHIQARDFDPRYQLWYICKPIMGAIFGWFVFLVYFVGFIAVQGATDLSKPQVAYVVAFLAGFSERFTIKIIDRLMQVLTTWEDQPTGSPSTAQQTK